MCVCVCLCVCVCVCVCVPCVPCVPCVQVRLELVEVLPRLKKGVLIHFHDVPQPCGDYRHEDWDEQEGTFVIACDMHLTTSEGMSEPSRW